MFHYLKDKKNFEENLSCADVFIKNIEIQSVDISLLDLAGRLYISVLVPCFKVRTIRLSDAFKSHKSP